MALVNDESNVCVYLHVFVESIIPSSGVFVVKLAKRGAGLGITISCKLPLALTVMLCRFF